MSHACTSEQAISAVAYLRRCFGGYELGDGEDRAFLRLFTSPQANYTPHEIQAAIDHLVLKNPKRRPGPSEVSEILQAGRVKGIDPIVAELSAKRLRWVSDHPDESVPFLDHFRDAPTVEQNEPEVTPEHVSQRLRSIKAEAGLK